MQKFTLPHSAKNKTIGFLPAAMVTSIAPFFLIAFFLIANMGDVQAQQDEQFTQFMYHKLGFNPAYAGMQESPTFTALYRQQWAGLDGAPQSQLITFNMPLTSKGIGLGGNITRHSIGATERYTGDVSYAYRFNLGRGGRLGIGLSSSIRLLRVDFGEVTATQPKEGDPSIPVGLQSKYVPNFGAGLYYSNQKFYLGISAPRLLTNNIDLAEETTVISREVPHYYLMGGVLIRMSEHIQLQPQAILKYVSGAPFDGDINLNLIFSETVYTGVSYRIGGSSATGIGEAGAILIGMQFNDHLLFGLAYDFTLSELRSYSNGTMEAILRYSISGRSRGNEVVSPRFF